MITMPKLNYIPHPTNKENTNIIHQDEMEGSKKIQMLEVASEKERNEMDFSKICENDELPPDLEPVD